MHTNYIVVLIDKNVSNDDLFFLQRKQTHEQTKKLIIMPTTNTVGSYGSAL